MLQNQCPKSVTDAHNALGLSGRRTWCLWEVPATASSSSWHSVRWPEQPSPGTRSQYHVHLALFWAPEWEPGIWSNHTVPWEQRREKLSHHQSVNSHSVDLERRAGQNAIQQGEESVCLRIKVVSTKVEHEAAKTMLSLDHFIHSFTQRVFVEYLSRC